MSFSPKFWTTNVGSVPYTESESLCERLVSTLDVPSWPQLPKRDFRENMYVQYSAVLPALVLDKDNKKIYFDTSDDISTDLEAFYNLYLDDNIDAFALPPEYATGFYSMSLVLAKSPGEWIKGQVTGPISFGLTVTDQELRASLYNELLADAILKNMAMIARWQVRQLRELRPNVIIFVDEPYMASFGSAFINLSRTQVVEMLDEVFEAIHSEGALAGVHCCANTDWSVLLDTKVDVLNLDAFGYLKNLALYTTDLRQFLARSGVIAWGIVPNNEKIYDLTAVDLAERLSKGFTLISEKAVTHSVIITPDELISHSLLSPSCGLGPTTEDIANQVLEKLFQLGEILQDH